jgi:hypothetical protein
VGKLSGFSRPGRKVKERPRDLGRASSKPIFRLTRALLIGSRDEPVVGLRKISSAGVAV